ncbi:hypothetical protein G9C98_000768 [Cotesia typhae]|uniref:Uncharacterized protein n=1 Tax=Cotesia typhae TaxID=2053667 RepID=A0A8J5QSX7_9HYME|nr:hypothetical protein G9C98_000768 [Cotesia typhae]
MGTNMEITLGVVCLLVFSVQAQNLTKNVLWIVVNSDQIDKLDNKSFPVKGFYENCENCTCDKFFRDNINDLINWAELKKINIGN